MFEQLIFPSRRSLLTGIAATLISLGLTLPPQGAAAQQTAEKQADPLPSWNAGEVKNAIVSFVERVTLEGGPHFVAPEDRVATFDNDGTLWSEQPFYFQLAFALDRIKAQAKTDPALAEKEPYRSVMSGDPAKVAALGEKGLAQIMALTHAGLTVDEFNAQVRGWLASARHPRFDRPYTDLVFQPMLELLAYLRANGFKTYVVSGGGIDFMRPWMPEVYGIPPEQIIGSSGKTAFVFDGDKPVIEKLPEIEFVDDGAGKPVGINRFIGRRPIFAAGNSDGDLQMLQWVAPGDGKGLALLVHHTDAEREWAYDRKSPIGKLDQALDEAATRGWHVIDMKNDWTTVFAFQK